MSNTKSISLADFNELKKVKGVYLIDFWATWCPPCKVMNPIIDELTTDEDLKSITFLNVDVDEQPELQTDFNVSSIPTFYLLNIKGDGSFDISTDVLGKYIGAKSKFDFKLDLLKDLAKA